MSFRSVLFLLLGAVAVMLALLQSRDSEQDALARAGSSSVIIAPTEVGTTPVPVSPPVQNGPGVTISRSDDGHFRSEVRINGRSVSMMLDSGASLVTLTEADAAAAGIYPAASAFTGRARTAGGEVPFAQVSIDRIALGGIERRNVAAAVVRGNMLPQSLLGQSFLGQVAEVRIADGEMRLR
jgi:aspartyl protease family protein